jgi:hypothetical protein
MRRPPGHPAARTSTTRTPRRCTATGARADGEKEADRRLARDARAGLRRDPEPRPEVQALIEEAFAAEKTREVSVAHHVQVLREAPPYVIPVALPDFASRVKAIDMLLTQAKGKPAETKTVDLKVFAAKTAPELEAMSEEELALARRRGDAAAWI